MDTLRDSFRLRESPALSNMESSKILSGMLLNHCLIYGASGDDDTIGNCSPDLSSPGDIALLVFKFSSKAMTIKSQVLFSSLPNFFITATAKVSKETTLWLHLTSKSALPQVIDHYNLPSSLLSIFADSSVFARTHSLGDRGSVIQLITVNMQDDIVNIKKLHIFIITGLVITFEQRSHAVVDTQQTNTFEHYSVPVNPLGLTRGTSLTVGSELNLDASSMGNDTSAFGKISGTFLSHIISRIDREDVHQQICSQGVGYLLAELVRGMLSIAYPVIRVHAKEMLALHDKVFLRQKKPDYYEGSFYLDQIAIFRLSYSLLIFALQETHELVDKLSGKGTLPVMDDVYAIPTDQRADVEYGYHRAIMQVQRLQAELERIHTNLRDLITRRNDRVNLMLTMTATTFLPLTFITGVFGMNFTKGGELVYILHQENGTYAFFAISLFSVFILMLWFYREGFFDMLTTREVNKHVTDLQKQQQSLGASGMKGVSFSTKGAILGLRSSTSAHSSNGVVSSHISRPIASPFSTSATQPLYDDK